MGVAISLLRKVGVEIEPGTVINIYGAPQVGKSTLAWVLAKEYAEENHVNAYVLFSEPTYYKDKFISLLKEVSGLEPSLIRIKSFDDVILNVEKMGSAVVIVDSVSTLADLEALKVLKGFVKKTEDESVLAPRLSPKIRRTAMVLKFWAEEKKGIAILITHAASTAGRYKYRGVSNYKPSLAQRAGHYLDYEVHLEQLGSATWLRKLTVVANRVKPWYEGRYVLFKFVKGGIEEYQPKEQPQVE